MAIAASAFITPKSRENGLTGDADRRADPHSIAVGDRVRWNGRYEGRVISLNGVTAVVVEKDNFALGRTVRWRLRLDALTRVE